MADTPAPLRSDPWPRLRSLTPARVGLARSGDALGLAHVLDFQAAHAAARDAVHAALDTDALAKTLAPRESFAVRSAAADRTTYLRRPDLGRRLDPACQIPTAADTYDVAFVLADGLSAGAVTATAPALVAACLTRLSQRRIAPIAIATQARVAIGDEIGQRLQAALVIVLIGERPGLSVAESLGAYLTWAPRPGRRDSERNCVSNIHATGGMTVEEAADLITRLADGARRLGASGVVLKDTGAVLEADARQGLCP